ncbi:hypothetical protein CHARACLAT_022817 [Characodon lateralis]|uniref:Uncharacterized protein n=1 Tax=Characodon lateralis TaxID=208331 RepID=A0ABU7EG52_9TELE|nr:hypothetical protein [Characodon lateralis]
MRLPSSCLHFGPTQNHNSTLGTSHEDQADKVTELKLWVKQQVETLRTMYENHHDTEEPVVGLPSRPGPEHLLSFLWGVLLEILTDYVPGTTDLLPVTPDYEAPDYEAPDYEVSSSRPDSQPDSALPDTLQPDSLPDTLQPHSLPDTPEPDSLPDTPEPDSLPDTPEPDTPEPDYVMTEFLTDRTPDHAPDDSKPGSKPDARFKSLRISPRRRLPDSSLCGFAWHLHCRIPGACFRGAGLRGACLFVGSSAAGLQTIDHLAGYFAADPRIITFFTAGFDAAGLRTNGHFAGYFVADLWIISSFVAGFVVAGLRIISYFTVGFVIAGPLIIGLLDFVIAPGDYGLCFCLLGVTFVLDSGPPREASIRPPWVGCFVFRTRWFLVFVTTPFPTMTMFCLCVAWRLVLHFCLSTCSVLYVLILTLIGTCSVLLHFVLLENKLKCGCQAFVCTLVRLKTTT